MNPLNDEELTSLLRQAKGDTPEPSREMEARALHAYRAVIRERLLWRDLLRRRLSVPWPLAAFIAFVCLLVGALAGRQITLKSSKALIQSSDALSTQPAAILRFKDFRPVGELKPRVIGRTTNDQ